RIRLPPKGWTVVERDPPAAKDECGVHSAARHSVLPRRRRLQVGHGVEGMVLLAAREVVQTGNLIGAGEFAKHADAGEAGLLLDFAREPGSQALLGVDASGRHLRRAFMVEH